MNYRIERIDEDNYPLFDAMIFWRENGFEREPLWTPVPQQIKKELSNPNLYVYAARVGNRYAGWISLLYLPKVGR